MRSSRAGSFFLLLLLLALGSAQAPSAFGQVTGFVESMGFDRAYRPDAWVPAVVNLKSSLPEPAEYLIQVVQPDMDGDTVLYSRLVTIGANDQAKYWVYFRPQPTGLDATSLAELSKMIQFRLLTKAGKHVELIRLTNGAVLQDFDPKTGFTARRGRKMVLAVVERSAPSTAEYEPQNILGLVEDVEFIKVSPDDLPENPTGYAMADAVVWFDADTAALSRFGARKLPALQDWVRQGGKLVVCQPDERQRIAAFGDMLPVEFKTPDDKWLIETVDRAEPEPLHTLATDPVRSLDDFQRQNSVDQWDRLKGPFKVARATPKPDVFVESWVDWAENEGGGHSPYIARSAYGLGSVTWVAQDLGSPAVAQRFTRGWPHVWDRVFGWKNKTVAVRTGDDVRNRQAVWGKLQDEWAANSMADLGGTLLRGMDPTGKAPTYVFLVILFFIGYWVVAGPGGYLFLAGKGQRQLSWPIFAVSAMAATLLTVLVVRLLLRGAPEVHHGSFVRLAPGFPAVVESRVGLYIPRDGPQTVSLREVHPESVSTLTALAVHPQLVGSESGFPDSMDYRIEVRDDSRTGGVDVTIPYRSTLKKLQVHWVGNLPGGAGIVGDPELIEAGSVGDLNGDGRRDGTIGGRVANKTGSDLKNVFFAFNYQGPGVPPRDHMLYVPLWKKDETLDLLRTFAGADWMSREDQFDKVTRGGSGAVWAWLDDQWGPNLLKQMRSLANADGVVDDSTKPVRLSVVVMSLFDRIPPVKNEGGIRSNTRAELLRRGGRELDMSHLLAAGNLVIIGEVDGAPLPFPMEVEGDRMGGDGRVIYQATLPMRNRSRLSQPATPEETPAGPAQAPATPAPTAG